MNNQIYYILNDMSVYLSMTQMKHLQGVLIERLEEVHEELENTSNTMYLIKFMAAKRIEGCSERTIQYYEKSIEKMLSIITLPIRQITTEALREYLITYQSLNNCSNSTLDNVRRNLSSFFSWLEEEDYILKNPFRRIHKIRMASTLKKTITDENIEILRDGCKTLRDLAMVDLLYTTGMRVGELVNLNIDDVDFHERICIVYGKGSKERRVYFDAETKIHLQNYIASRIDNNDALFVSLLKPHRRFKINGVEIRIRELGRNLGIKEVYPHKFRRTMATRAIDKGMPIEQVQKLLGHKQIDTTMRYAIVNQTNVRNSYKKYIGS
ncbi:MAG: tyrosine-type recombinase/integrase [Clostridiales bacterium]|nr:tyrosine-type recombinase/integrase [Clostridiales bacterium]